eukprot:scaffold115774_cov69-Phaeocystis_antarctica.AAC.1
MHPACNPMYPGGRRLRGDGAPTRRPRGAHLPALPLRLSAPKAVAAAGCVARASPRNPNPDPDPKPEPEPNPNQVVRASPRRSWWNSTQAHR